MFKGKTEVTRMASAQLAFTFSKSAIGILIKGVKYVQSQHKNTRMASMTSKCKLGVDVFLVSLLLTHLTTFIKAFILT